MSLNQLTHQHLYHRKPNLLLENVVDVNEQQITTSMHLTHDHPLIQGHFPGLPILPGTQMLEMAIQSAGLYMSHIHYPDHRAEKLSVGIFRKCHGSTFKNFARPDQHIICDVKQVEKVDNLHEFSAHVKKENGDTLMKARFSITTVPEDLLREK